MDSTVLISVFYDLIINIFRLTSIDLPRISVDDEWWLISFTSAYDRDSVLLTVLDVVRDRDSSVNASTGRLLLHIEFGTYTMFLCRFNLNDTRRGHFYWRIHFETWV